MAKLYRQRDRRIIGSVINAREHEMETMVRRDTRAWRIQVWISFGLALLVCTGGLAALPGAELDRAFMVMGYAFCLTSAFALAKFVRDAEGGPKDTPLWRLVVWGSFALAMALTGWGLWRMEINPTWKAYLLVSWLYLISCAFTLAKTLRDAWEADRAEARLCAAGEPERHDVGPAAARTTVGITHNAETTTSPMR